MQIPFEGAQRSQWMTSSRLEFFKKIESLFGRNLSTEDKIEIKLRLHANDPEYFELPIYNKKNDSDPCVIVIFEKDMVLIDFIDLETKAMHLEKIQSLVGPDAQPIKWRPLTQKDWIKRLGALDSLTTI
jgi:hypothetical protein